MDASPLIETFKSLSKKERRDLSKWVRSPFFNQRQDVIRLFDHLDNYFKNTASGQADTNALSKKAVFSIVFHEKLAEKASTTTQTQTNGLDYDDSAMRYAMSFLYSQIKVFLSWNEWAADARLTKLSLCQALKKRQLGAIFEHEWAIAHSNLLGEKERSLTFFWHDHRLRLEQFEWSRAQKRAGGTADLDQVGASFGAYVAANVLRQGCAVLSQQAVSRLADLTKIDFLEATLSAVEAGRWADLAAVQLYFHGFRALQNPEDAAHFYEFKKWLNSHGQAFPPAELRDLWMLAINYSIRRVNAGEASFFRDAFELYRSGLSNRVLLEDGQLSPFTYKNVLHLGMSLSEWDWCGQFLEEYRSYLPKKERENIYRVNLASFYFRQNDFEKTLDLLRFAEFRDPMISLDQRRMLLKIYFQKQEITALESLLQSFETYLRRRGDAVGYHRESFVNLVKFVKKLLKINLHDNAAREKFRMSVQSAKFLAEREWLLSVVEIRGEVR